VRLLVPFGYRNLPQFDIEIVIKPQLVVLWGTGFSPKDRGGHLRKFLLVYENAVDVLLQYDSFFALFRFFDVRFCSGVDVEPFRKQVAGDRRGLGGNVVWSSTPVVSKADYLAEMGGALLSLISGWFLGDCPFAYPQTEGTLTFSAFAFNVLTPRSCHRDQLGLCVSKCKKWAMKIHSRNSNSRFHPFEGLLRLIKRPLNGEQGVCFYSTHLSAVEHMGLGYYMLPCF
jgi:hypothetical protein